jgi:hypothetical protein
MIIFRHNAAVTKYQEAPRTGATWRAWLGRIQVRFRSIGSIYPPPNHYLQMVLQPRA